MLRVRCKMFIHNGVYLCPIEFQDLHELRTMRNEPNTWSVLGDPFLIHENDQTRWFESLSKENKRQYFAYCDLDLSSKNQSNLLGLIRMDEIDNLNRSIRVGGDVLPRCRGQGFGTKMYHLVFKYCFDVLNKRRIWLLVLDYNESAKNLYHKVGMAVEGKQREAVFRNGRYHDYIMMSILEPHYRELYSND